MRLGHLKMTAAVLALTAGSAWAQTSESSGVTVDLSGDATATAETDGAMKPIADTANEIGEGVIDAAESAAAAAQNAADEAEETATDLVNDAQSIEVEGDVTVESDLGTDTDKGADSAETDMAADAEVNTDTDMTAEADVATNGNTAAVPTEMANSFSGMVVGDIVGQELIEANGESLGEVEYVVRDGNRLSAVVGIGGFLGFGQHTVAVPLDDISLAEENTLKLNTSTKAQLKAQPEVDQMQIERLETDVSLDLAS